MSYANGLQTKYSNSQVDFMHVVMSESYWPAEPGQQASVPAQCAALWPNTCCCAVKKISSGGSTAAPVNTGVKIPTCKLSMRETFQTSPADLYSVFLKQEVRTDGWL